MSQKRTNETTVLALSFILTAALLALGLWWFTRSGVNQSNLPEDSTTSETTAPTNSNSTQQPVSERISAGDNLLITSEATPEKQAATEAIASGNFEQAVSNLEAALESDRNDPEALIYLNNARIGTQTAYTIAVSVPIGSDVNAAQEMLRGVAQAQDVANAGSGINGIPLKVIVANDDNDPEVAQQVAQELADNTNALGVVGHFSSDVTLAAGNVYEAEGLTAISPTSTSVAISTAGDYLFRTVPSDRFAGSTLARHMLNELEKQKAVVFFNSQSNYSQSLKNEFTTALFGEGGEVVAEFDLSRPEFNAVSAVQQAVEGGAEAIVLAPNGAILDKALQVVQVNEGRLPLLAGDSVYAPETLQMGRTNAIGMVVAIPWHILGNPNAEFPRTASQLWGAEVNWRTAMAYDATEALIAAIAQNPNRMGVQQALSSPNFATEGAAGTIRFLPSGDRNQAAQLVTIQAGDRTGFGYDFVPVP